MSGTFQSRVNRLWAKDQPNISAAVFFWEHLKFIDAHAGMSFVGYGTGKVQTGTTPPAAWLNWNPLVDAVPWSDNSWFVYNADNADALLNGGGLNQWQVKVQVTLATGFDDCNVADVDYGQETQTYVCCLRCSINAGWNGTSLDFPADADLNRAAYQGQDELFNVDYCGDDDTIYWRGSAFDVGDNKYNQSRGGYIGMLQRRSAVIDEPFFSMIGKMSDLGANVGVSQILGKVTGNSYYVFGYGYSVGWPSYSLWHDGTRIQGIDVHRLDPWTLVSLNNLRHWRPTGEDIFPAMLVAQWTTPEKYAIIGELRFMYACGSDKGEGQIIGSDPQWIQICAQCTTYGGVVMRWPAGVVPVW